MYKYTYSIANDTLNGKANTGKLSQEVLNSPITVALNSVSTRDDVLTFDFKATLAQAWQDELDSIVSNHDGEPIVYKEVVSVEELANSKKDNIDIIKRSIVKPSGNYNSIVSHNYCDSLSWESDSSFTIKPPVDKIWHIDRSEAQFSDNFDLSSTNKLILEYYAWIGNGAEAIAETLEFDSIYRLFEIGNEHFYCPPKNLSTLKFNQPTILSLYGSEKVGELSKMVIRTSSDNELTGDYGSVSVVAING
jgi:hypothetical protein